LTFTFKLVQARDQTRLPCELAQIRSAVLEMFHTQAKQPQRCQNTNLPQFTACGKNGHTCA